MDVQEFNQPHHALNDAAHTHGSHAYRPPAEWWKTLSYGYTPDVVPTKHNDGLDRAGAFSRARLARYKLPGF